VQRFREIAADLAARKVDVILAMQPYALIGAHQATHSVPIVAVDLEHDPVESGFVASLARPGGNVTGIFLDQADLAGKHVQLLREMVPGLARLAVLWDGNVSALQFRAIGSAAQALGVTVQSFEVRSREGFDRAFAVMARGRPGAVAVVSSPLVWSERSRIARYTLEQRLPTISLFDDFPSLGGLMAYGPASWPELYRSAATLVAAILRGAKPGELPVDRPARFQMVVNAKTARAIGLNLPPSVLARADRIIE
jgi:putative ABC transport system substrate-binding protein